MSDPRLGLLLTEAMVRNTDAIIDGRDDDRAPAGGGAFGNSRSRADIGIERSGIEIPLEREPDIGDLQDSGIDELAKGIASPRRDEEISAQHPVHARPL